MAAIGHTSQKHRGHGPLLRLEFRLYACSTTVRLALRNTRRSR